MLWTGTKLVAFEMRNARMRRFEGSVSCAGAGSEPSVARRPSHMAAGMVRCLRAPHKLALSDVDALSRLRVLE